MQFGLKSMSPAKAGSKFGNSFVRCAIVALPAVACLASAAHAQSGVPSILPADFGSTVASNPQVPSAAASPALPTGQALITLNFKDVPVADLITMIAEQGNVSIIVANDVTDVLRNVSLNDKTPEQAIQFVAETAGLAWRKLDARTYAIAKELKDLPSDRIATAGAATQAPVTALPGITQSGLQAAAPSLELPQLYQGAGEREEPKIYSYLPLRNVTPRIMAWWLDPAHNPIPVQFKASDDTLRKSTNTPLAAPALSNNAIAAINGYSNVQPQGDTYNPWSPAGSINRSDADMYSGSMQSNDVYTQASPQFGTRGNNTRGNQRGNQRGGRNGAAGGQGVFELPEGVDSLVAVDPQNALLVRGRPDAIAQLEEIIGLLDKPLRQVEIEAQFVTVGTQDSKAFGIDFQSANGPFRLNTTGRAPTPTAGTFSLGYVRNNFRATLNALQQQGKTKTVSSPRVTAINNLTASLTSSTATPLILNTVATNLSGTNSTGQQLIYISTNIGLSVTPTINNDDTITVVMQPEVSTQVPNTDTGLPTILQNRIETIANVKDGDTIALGGLRTKSLSTSKSGVPIIRNIPIIGKLFESNNTLDTESELIIFLTARIVRRVEDPVPGT